MLGTSACLGRCSQRPRVSGVIYLYMMCLFLICVGTGVLPGQAEELGRISGTVQRNAQGVPDHRIMLIRFGPDQEVHRIPGQTDAQGRFDFTNLETGTTFEYFVGIRYAGTLYRSEPIRLQPGQQRSGVVVDVAEAAAIDETAPPPPLYIASHLIGIALRDGNLIVREDVKLVKQGNGGAQETMPIRLPLPQEYSNFVPLAGFEPAHTQMRPTGVDYTAPLSAGEHQLVYSYMLPFRGRVWTLLAERTLLTARLDILVEEEHLVAASDLPLVGRVHGFFHLHGAALPARTRSWLQLTHRGSVVPGLRLVTYSLMGGIVLLGLLLPWYHTRQRRKKAGADINGYAAEEVQALHTTHLRLLQAIAHLDDQHASGMVAEAEYQRQRDDYKQQLYVLVQQLQHARHAGSGSAMQT